MQAVSSSDVKLPSECTPATLSFKGKVVRIHVEGMSSRAAIFTSDALSAFVRDFSVTLTATICGKKAKPIATQSLERKGGIVIPRICPIRIIIYGINDEKDAIADALSNGGLFLQHPSESEFDREVKYINPQYLLPPGEKMPRIEDLNVSRCCVAYGNSAGLRESLGEVERNAILRIFDSACNSEAGLMVTIKPSPRLRAKLKMYANSSVC
jgi:SWI/SNF-related matrix-associated actin-dependent regulator of chromatin subfamily A3